MTGEFEPYRVDTARYKRFDQRNTCFSRRKWDRDFVAYGKGIYDKAVEKIRKGIEGYSRDEFAMIEAAWYMHDLFPVVKTCDTISDERNNFPELGRVTYELTAEENSAILKKFGKELGASLVGTTKLDMNWVYSHHLRKDVPDLDDYSYAVVFTVPMDQRSLRRSPTYQASIAVGVAYSRCRMISESLARFIHKIGYKAIPAVNDIALSVPLAIDAGLGEFARNGLLIEAKYGMAVRIGKVLTDLPLEQDLPVDLGVRRFCITCKKCAESCPVSAISFSDLPDGKVFSKSNNPGVLKWYVNVDKCYKFWTINTSDCSNCIANCPFTKPNAWKHNIVRAIVKRTGAFNSILTKADDLLYR